MKPVVRLLKRVVGAPVSVDDYNELWADVSGSVAPSTNVMMPDLRLRAVRLAEDMWDVVTERRVINPWAASPISGAFTYAAVGQRGLDEPCGVSTEQMLSVLRSYDPSVRPLPGHVSRVACV